MFPRAALSVLALAALAPAAHADVYVSGGYRYYPPPPPAATTVVVRPAWWYAGVGVVGTSILDQSGGPETLRTGGGVSAWLGVNLSSALSVELGWLGSFHNPQTYSTYYGRDTSFLVLEGVTADAKIHLGRGPIDPYLQGGVGVYFLGDSAVGFADSVGPGYQLGGGIDLWVGRHVTLGGRALYRGIAMGPPDGGPADTFVHAATVEGSVAFHF
jgi:hypothetical protein